MQMKLTYTACKDGILYPNLAISHNTTPIGMWGQKRLNFLKENRKGLYVVLKTQGTLYDHLTEVDEAAEAMFEGLASKLAKSNGATETLKAADQMQWVGIVNNARNSAEEIVRAELIYS
jgi:hypothetical protein